jgi:hypothetical protein
MYCVAYMVIQQAAVSNSETSTTPPTPVVCRRIRSERIPIAAHMPEPMSTMEGPTRTGAPPASPTTLMMPPKACISGS